MRAREFVVEDVKLRKAHAQAMTGAHLARDPNTVDRIYHMNRMMMAMAMADGKSKKPVDMDISSWSEKYNTIHPFSDADNLKIQSALKTVPSDHGHIGKNHKSKEYDDINKVSPVAKPKKNKYGI